MLSPRKKKLQKMLSLVFHWPNSNEMFFSVNKCVTIFVKNIKFKNMTNYVDPTFYTVQSLINTGILWCINSLSNKENSSNKKNKAFHERNSDLVRGIPTITTSLGFVDKLFNLFLNKYNNLYLQHQLPELESKNITYNYIFTFLLGGTLAFNELQIDKAEQRHLNEQLYSSSGSHVSYMEDLAAFHTNHNSVHRVRWIISEKYNLQSPLDFFAT
ncbi:hypothetical protein PIROE2DRAFT_6570 [Piromyces sp. E2]|nr:hypothetical protein PIROE2DRAFT_6570 [Piromyces sp. E2]|eukprot:OUM66232.1 hypothetical protein PIROE2DRAFT_6570 [Piromyces sp. E2]